MRAVNAARERRATACQHDVDVDQHLAVVPDGDDARLPASTSSRSKPSTSLATLPPSSTDATSGLTPRHLPSFQRRPWCAEGLPLDIPGRARRWVGTSSCRVRRHAVCEAAADKMAECRIYEALAERGGRFPVVISRGMCADRNKCSATCVAPATCAEIDSAMVLGSTHPSEPPATIGDELHRCLVGCNNSYSR